MNLVKAFMATLIIAMVFMVIALMYVNLHWDDSAIKDRQSPVYSILETGHALRFALHQNYKGEYSHKRDAANDGGKFPSTDPEERRTGYKENGLEHDESPRWSLQGVVDNNARLKESALAQNATPLARPGDRGNRGNTNPRTGGQKARDQGSSCEEKVNILLLKTHKTGSSTLQNVLYRFGDVRNLTFALPAVDVYMGSPAKFKSSYAIPSPTGKYNILANHARFHEENMKKVMAPGTKFITILRYPPKQFESMYSYYKMESRYGCSLETFVASPWTFYQKRREANLRHSGLNPMLYDLGLEYRALSDDIKVERWIEYVDKSFDLVLIAEYLKESLILLKEMMCWTFDDIVYFTSNARSGMLVQSLSPETEKNLLQWHHGDVKLYQHFNATLWKKIQEYGVERMAGDVAELTRQNEEMMTHCIQGTKKVKEMGGKTVIKRYVLRPEVAKDMNCKRITYPAFTYLNILKTKSKLKRGSKKV